MSVISGIAGAIATGSASDTQAEATQNAANTSAQASNYAADIQKQMYNQTRTDQTPWRNAGVNALGQLTAGTQQGGSLIRPFSMADYQQDPGYSFRLSEGIKALNNQAAARGGLLSGAQLKAAQQYGQDYASNEYQNAYNRYNNNQTTQFNRLASMAGLGQNANSATQQAGQNYANNTGNILMTNAANQGNAALMAGQARASAYGGWGQVAGNSMNSLGNYYMNNYNDANTWAGSLNSYLQDIW